MAMPRLLAALFAVVAVAVTTTAASARSSTIPVVHRGQVAKLALSPGGTQDCLASVQYADGLTQNTGIKSAVRGKVSWSIRVPNNAAVGIAHWNVRCGPTWKRTGRWHVVGSTQAVPSKPVVLVTKSGFSQRPSSFDPGSKVSFGMFLKNTSSRDAENVYLLVNFVGAGGELLGTLSHNVNYIPAGQTFNYGDEMSLRTQLLVTKLEVTVRVGGGAPAVPHPVPHFSNILIVPDRGDPTWVSEVDGEVANDTSPATMTSAQISVVVLDPNGAIVGGGQTTLYTALPSGSRMVFLAQSGFSDIPSNKAGSVAITAQPQYQTG